jgi:hypothetical protein
MLPALRQTKPVSLKRKRCYDKHFLPFKNTDLESGGPIQFVTASTINGVLARHHGKMPGMPALGSGCHPRHYRHVSLSSMHFVGAAEAARVLSTHAADSMVFRESYKIADVNPDFKARYLRVHELSCFAQLTSPERLLL